MNNALFVSLLIAVCYVSTQTSVAPLSFEVASVKAAKPNETIDPARTGIGCHGRDGTYPVLAGVIPPPLGRCVLPSVGLKGLINVAYDVYAEQPIGMGPLGKIVGLPEWADRSNADRFTIEAKAENAENTTKAELIRMLQTLLAERFKLKLHRETRNVKGFVLVVARNGSKLVAGDPSQPRTNFGPPEWRGATVASIAIGPDLKATGVTLSPYLTSALTAVLGVPVVDKTGLTGAFDFTLKWSPDERQFGGRGLRGQRDPMGPSLFTALQEQLGLRLIAEEVPFEVIVVDSVEKPSPN